MANKKANPKSNFQKIQATAKNINAKIAETIKTLADDTKNNSKEFGNSFDNIQYKDSLNTITSTFKYVNEQVFNTASEIIEDGISTTQKVGTEMLENAKERIEKIDTEKNIDTIKTAFQNINKQSVEIAEDVVIEVTKSAEKWQDIAQKAVKGGFQLADKQQDIVFDTLDTVKSQFQQSAVRLRKLFGAKK